MNGMDLAFPHGNIPTHFPHNSQLQRTAINLVWVNLLELLHDDFRVASAPEDQILSDHAPIYISYLVDTHIRLSPCISKGSDKHADFIDRVLVAWLTSSLSPLETAVQIEHVCEEVHLSIAEAFTALAHVPSILHCSQLWWNKTCSDALKVFQLERTRENRFTFYAACKATCHKMHNKILAESCQSNWVWDLTSWVKPRSLNTTRALIGLDGNPISSLD